MKFRPNVSDTLTRFPHPWRYSSNSSTSALTDSGSVAFQVRRLGLDEDAPWCPVVANLAEEERGTCEEWKRVIWMVFEEPDSCKLALGVNLWVPYSPLRGAAQPTRRC